MIVITWSDWQQRLELVEPEIAPERRAEVEKAVKRINEDLERCMIGLPPLAR